MRIIQRAGEQTLKVLGRVDESGILTVTYKLKLEWLDLKALQQYACVSERTLREWIHRPVNPVASIAGWYKDLDSSQRIRCLAGSASSEAS